MKKNIIIALLVVLLAGVGIGWLVRGGSEPANDSVSTEKSGTTPPSQTQGVGNQAASSEVKALVSYSVPDGWQEASCDGKQDTVYVLPKSVALDCNATPSAPISISLDQGGATDCSQLDGQDNVRKHTCKSLNIDGRKSLKASTEYNPSPENGNGQTVSSYYVDTGKGIVKVEYRYSGAATYQSGYDEIANSIAVKD